MNQKKKIICQIQWMVFQVRGRTTTGWSESCTWFTQFRVLRCIFLALFIFPFWSKIRMQVGLCFFHVILTFKFVKTIYAEVYNMLFANLKWLPHFCQASQRSFRRKNCDSFPKTPRQRYQLWKSFWFLHFKGSVYSVSVGQQWSLSLSCTRPFSHPFNSLTTTIPLSGKQPHQQCAPAIGFVSKICQGLIRKLQEVVISYALFSRCEDPVFATSLEDI